MLGVKRGTPMTWVAITINYVTVFGNMHLHYQNDNHYYEFRCIPAKNAGVCTYITSKSLMFLYIIDRLYSRGHIYIHTFSNIIKLVYYGFLIVAKCWAVVIIIFNKIDDCI